MAVRKIVCIDESKCNGCGLCIPNCAKGALSIIEDKARLIMDIYCDGLGACLGHCPKGAITIIEREANEFNEEAVKELQQAEAQRQESKNKTQTQSSECPGRAVRQLGPKAPFTNEHVTHGCSGSRMRAMQRQDVEVEHNDIRQNSKLRQWPVQLQLVPATAAFFKGADLLVTADCVPFSYANYHNDFLKGKALVVGCPKLDDIKFYSKKIEDIIKLNNIESITVLRMEVPCCGGITQATKIARDNSGINMIIKVVTISLEGEILKTDHS